MKILAFDVESTGLDLINDQVIEVGAALWCSKRQAPLKIYNQFVFRENQTLSEEIQNLTGIKPEDLTDFGQPVERVVQEFQELISHADTLMAHNGLGFDLPMMKRFFQETGQTFPEITLIDTLMDLPPEPQLKSRSLSSLLTHNEILNYFPHRAFSDALCMVKMASKYNIEEVSQRAQTRAVKVVAQVDYHNKDKAKNAGFYWEPQKKHWYKVMREFDYKPESFNFSTQLLDL